VNRRNLLQTACSAVAVLILPESRAFAKPERATNAPKIEAITDIAHDFHMSVDGIGGPIDRVSSGRIIIRKDSPLSADDFRDFVTPTLQPGYNRVEQTFSLDATGKSLDYRIVDRQVMEKHQ
jgi:hypothetical protein